MVDVAGDVQLGFRGLTHIPVQFGSVDGSFNIQHNLLISLKGCPNYVKEGYYCNSNKLSSLQYCPQYVGGDFICSTNNLTNFLNCPHTIKGFFYCLYNQIDSLEFCPQNVGGRFYCAHNSLLGHVQDITDFSEIYQIHLEIKKIKEEKYFLSQSICLHQKNDQNPQYKI